MSCVFCNVVSHNLRIFGLPCVDGKFPNIEFFHSGEETSVQKWTEAGGIACVQLRERESDFMGVKFTWNCSIGTQSRFRATEHDVRGQTQLTTFHSYATLSVSEPGIGYVKDDGDRDVWMWKPMGKGGAVLIGTALGKDLVRFRQGDASEAKNPDIQTRWGVAAERPNYLFESQRQGAAKYDRSADWWAMLLSQILASVSGLKLLPLLPNNAKGAIVITGDDDQAYLEKYQAQLTTLDGLPITYFLHPNTRHTPETLKTILGSGQVDLGLHPDAIEMPDQYEGLFSKQAAWFNNLTGQKAVSVRNHAYLNDGYWGHLKSWNNAGVAFSSNIPGLDGELMTGSMIPARVVYGDQLTDHWSLLTAIGDGIIFVHKMQPMETRACVMALAQEMILSGLPGVLVVNLHPQNVSQAIGLHGAIRELVEDGFVAWNMKQCLSWFRARDGKSSVSMS